KRRGEIVASRFDQYDIELGERLDHLLDGLNIHRRISADSGMRAGAALDRKYAPGIDKAAAPQALCVFAGDQVVCDHRHLECLRGEGRNKPFAQRRLAWSYRSADPA